MTPSQVRYQTALRPGRWWDAVSGVTNGDDSIASSAAFAPRLRRALLSYVTTMTTRQNTALEPGGGSGLERVRALLSLIVDDELANRSGGRGAGCFTVNTPTTVASRHPEVSRVIETDLRERLASLRLTFTDGQRDGSVTGARTPEELAWFTVSLISGMRVAAQSGADRQALEGIAATGIGALTA